MKAPRYLRSVVVFMAVIGMMFGTILSAAASTTGLGVDGMPVTGTNQGGNVECAEIDPDLLTVGERSDVFPNTVFNEDRTVQYGTEDGIDLWWSANKGIDVVIVKGSDAALAYFYDPAATGDTGLQAPVNASGDPAGLSNVTFCYYPDPPVTEVYGCSQGFYKNWASEEILNMTLSGVGFTLPPAGDATFLYAFEHGGSGKVDTGTYSGYLRQAITAYINALLIPEYAFTTAEVVAGYNSGTISESTFDWNNHGAEGVEGFDAICPFDANDN